MATPLTATAFLNALRAEGVTVHEVGDWRTHNRNHKGPWGPVHGVVIHHTASSGTQHSVELCRTGYSELPGPLCHGVIPKDGSTHIVGYGRTNHAGSGDEDVLNAVIAEKPLPVDDENNVDGNRYLYGFECVNLGNGSDPWPAEQIEGMVRAAAAVCRAHGWSAASVIGHKEWQPGKPDPRGIDMDDFRRRVQARLDGGKPTEPSKPEQPKPQPPAFPGREFFGPGKSNNYITELGRALVRKGFGKHYTSGPGPKWSEADRRNTEDFQHAQGWTGTSADGYPGPETWRRLFS